MSRLSEIVNRCSEDALNRGGRCRIEDVVACVISDNEEVVREEMERLAHNAIHRKVKEFFRRAAENDGVETGAPGQLGLPGFAEPAAIAVSTDDGGVEYVSFAAATWADLNAALGEREQNFERVEKRLLDFREKVAYLRPFMELAPDRTVAEAAALIQRVSTGAA
jgi:superfamily I DNA and RNA helicase